MPVQVRGFRKTGAEHSRALDRVREWARERFRLAAEDTVTVAEVQCALPGCPPLETVIVFWVDEQRHHLKVFKPVAEVTPDDLPPAWLRPALAVDEDFVCDCC